MRSMLGKASVFGTLLKRYAVWMMQQKALERLSKAVVNVHFEGARRY